MGVYEASCPLCGGYYFHNDGCPLMGGQSEGTVVWFDIEDADISNPPDEVTWYSINDPNASWNLPK